MSKVRINIKTCINCGNCVTVCPKQVFRLDHESAVAWQPDVCIECYHCLSVCPSGSVTFDQPLASEIADIKPFNAENLEYFLSSVRSIRRFKEKDIHPEILKKLIRVAQQAPAASNWRTSEITVISEKDKIHKMEEITIEHFRGLKRKFNPVVIKIVSLFSKHLGLYLKKMYPSFKKLISRFENEEKPIFYNAPHVLIFHGPSINPMSKDNCDGMIHYLRIYAQSTGLGSCIIGYAMSSRKEIQKYLNLPKGNNIYGVLIIGYPLLNFNKHIIRKSVTLNKAD